MNRMFARLLLLCASYFLVSLAASAITNDTVPVGNAGNAFDQYNRGQGQFGAVASAYRIGTYEVTNAQYATFLNAKATSDSLALYNTNMGNDPHGGVTRSGSSPNFSYDVKANMGNKPVNYVSWYDAIRFANWLNNGQGTGDTETGAYTLLGATPTPSNGLSITRNAGAAWFLPSEDEWYKAAYHQPAIQGGDADDYWIYPTASNNVPKIATINSAGDISNPGANVANYDYNSQNGKVTTVGSAGPFSESFYGTSDQGGNVSEWNETLISGSFRGVRGGSYNVGEASLSSSSRFGNPPIEELPQFGFRVASVPEPGTGVLATVACAFVWALRRRLL